MTENTFVTTLDGVRLAFDEKGSGAPVVFVHGLGLSRKRWEAQVRAVAEAGYRAVRYDLRGFGESGDAPVAYTLDTLVEDLETVADRLGLGDLHLVGHSLGGMVCQLFTLAQPERVRSLTLASSTAHQGRRSAVLASVLVKMSEIGFDAFLADVSLRTFGEDALREIFPDGAPPLDYFRMKDLEEPNPSHAYAWATTGSFSTKERLHEIACPVLILHGKTDPLIPFKVGQWLHDGLPGSRFVALDGGHSIQVEAAEEFNRELLAFLEATSPR